MYFKERPVKKAGRVENKAPQLHHEVQGHINFLRNMWPGLPQIAQHSQIILQMTHPKQSLTTLFNNDVYFSTIYK